MPNGMPQSDDCLPYLQEQVKKLRIINNSPIIREQKEQAIVIGFAGKDRAGKSTLSLLTKESLGTNTYICSFADDIRKIISDTFGNFLNTTHKTVFGDGIEPPKVGSDWLKINKPLARKMMRTFGTDVVRKKVDIDYWVLLAQYKYFYKGLKNANVGSDTISKLHSQRETENSYMVWDPFDNIYIFEDVRFSNELEWIKSFDKSVVFYCCSDDERGKPGPPEEYAKSKGLVTRTDVKSAEVIWTPKTNGAEYSLSYLSECGFFKTDKQLRIKERLKQIKYPIGYASG